MSERERERGVRESRGPRFGPRRRRWRETELDSEKTEEGRRRREEGKLDGVRANPRAGSQANFAATAAAAFLEAALALSSQAPTTVLALSLKLLNGFTQYSRAVLLLRCNFIVPHKTAAAAAAGGGSSGGSVAIAAATAMAAAAALMTEPRL
jgi:hypothetical protein